jgi:hypothetical protein
VLNRIPMFVALVIASQAAPGMADWTDARCDVYPAGEDHTDVMIPCRFSQRQGYVTIDRSDGVTHELAPEAGTPGNFRDQDGRAVYRQSGLGDQGLIFRFPDESVFVYWSTASGRCRHPDLAVHHRRLRRHHAVALPAGGRRRSRQLPGRRPAHG